MNLKKIICGWYALGIALHCSAQESLIDKNGQQTDNFSVASYNIRYQAKVDEESGNSWEIRRRPLAELILRHGFDIVGTQEGNVHQLKDLSILLPGYVYLGEPYGGSDGHLHNCAVFYKKDLFSITDSGVFWFSETPDTPSIGWDATDRRICHWVKFKEKATSKEFFFFNVHFFWRLKLAKVNSGPLLVKKIKEIAKDHPVICVGDFNSRHDTSQIIAVKELLSDAYDGTISPPSGVEGTSLSGGVFKGPPGQRIDYIFTSNHFVIKNYKVLSDTYNDDRYPSDHLPVTSLLKWSDLNRQ